MDKIRADKGLPPVAREDEVEPFSDLLWAWVGFWRLSNARPQGFNGPCRIPISETAAYCKFAGFDYAKSQDFMVYIERLDAKYMEYVAEEMESSKNAKPGARAPSRRKD